jgi:dTDP-4-dehydrorhamnose reductase
MKIFITGGSGYLGQKLIKSLLSDHIVYAPDKEECNVTYLENINTVIKPFSPELVIHLAAFVDTFGCENDIKKALDINVTGTINVTKACSDLNCKLVYISSEYVFNGDKGNYSIEDRLDPINVYGKTKAAAEYIVSTLLNYQIIRAPFIRQIYPKVFTDQYCSRYFLDEIVEKIINNIFNNKEKIVHISSERMSLYDLYLKKGIKAEPITMSEEQKRTLPKDTSLINNSI